jgi:hypothetical protein
MEDIKSNASQIRISLQVSGAATGALVDGKYVEIGPIKEEGKGGTCTSSLLVLDSLGQFAPQDAYSITINE